MNWRDDPVGPFLTKDHRWSCLLTRRDSAPSQACECIGIGQHHPLDVCGSDDTSRSKPSWPKESPPCTPSIYPNKKVDTPDVNKRVFCGKPNLWFRGCSRPSAIDHHRCIALILSNKYLHLTATSSPVPWVCQRQSLEHRKLDRHPSPCP
jgi:hypothetical protein